MQYIVLIIILVAGSLYHASFLHLNEVLKVADSFAYLQMSHYLSEFSYKGLGNGWFGFVYSAPIALVSHFFTDPFYASKIVNIILFNISGILLWIISRNILSHWYASLVVILFFLSQTLLHFNIHTLSENIYIPLFLLLFWLSLKFMKKAEIGENFKLIPHTVLIGVMLGLMYLTRAEAFIYMLSIGIISLLLLEQRRLSFGSFVGLGAVFFISFFMFISPYLFHLHNLTGEWGLTNKGASNLRQAELRGVERMDDAGFERAVAELTPDNTQLIAGFAGGMEYVRPQIDLSLGEFVAKNPRDFALRVQQNQKKFFSKNLPEIFLGESPKLLFSSDRRFANPMFLLYLLLPLSVLIYGFFVMYKERRDFCILTLSFFLPALFFFTLFFTLNRYFIIFLPIILIFFCYALQSMSWIRIIFLGNYVSLLLLSTLVYYSTESQKDEYYTIKQEAGIWLSQNSSLLGEQPSSLKIMERFPIVTYYSGSLNRYITPYADDIADIYEYGIYNDIDVLVVDTLDFKEYRPKLLKYLDETPENFEKLREFSNPKGQKVILYGLIK